MGLIINLICFIANAIGAIIQSFSNTIPEPPKRTEPYTYEDPPPGYPRPQRRR